MIIKKILNVINYINKCIDFFEYYINIIIYKFFLIKKTKIKKYKKIKIIIKK